VLDEDIRMIEGQQSRLDPKRSFVDINEDAGQIHTRNLLTRLIAEEQNF
jgi:phenylpropionate dioxygenase-like ring-hydroxylating dioxygenase large terminal subunit